jgi:hypothetical protein
MCCSTKLHVPSHFAYFSLALLLKRWSRHFSKATYTIVNLVSDRSLHATTKYSKLSVLCDCLSVKQWVCSCAQNILFRLHTWISGNATHLQTKPQRNFWQRQLPSAIKSFKLISDIQSLNNLNFIRKCESSMRTSDIWEKKRLTNFLCYSRAFS